MIITLLLSFKLCVEIIRISGRGFLWFVILFSDYDQRGVGPLLTQRILMLICNIT